MSSATQTQPLVEVRDLKVHFPVKGGILKRTVGHVKAVNGVSLTVPPKSLISVVGESGCGKSTLGNAILGLVRPTSGTLRLGGQDLDIHRAAAWKPYRRDYQVIFQDPYSSLNPRHTVYEIVAEPMLVHGMVRNKDEARAAVAENLRKVGLSADYMERYPHAFSGGQRQRISIARAIALRPKLIVADEIVSALDVSVQAQIVNLLLELKEDLGLSLLFISHDLSLVRTISDHVYVMYLGQIAEHGETDALYSQPSHPYTRALLDSIPTLDRSKKPMLLSGEVPSPVNPPPGCKFHTRCPMVQQRCKEDEPRLEQHGNTDAACWFPL